MMTRLSTAALGGALALLAGCDEGPAPNADNAAAPARTDQCRTMPVRDMNETDYTCAYAAEIQAIADLMATIGDKAAAERAVPAIRKSAARLTAVFSQRARLNDAPAPGAAAARSMTKFPALVAANKAFVRESIRLAREHPDAMMVISPALDGIER